MIKAVFFDVGGVLVRDSSGLVRRRLLDILGRDIPRKVFFGREWDHLLKGKISESVFCRRMFGKLGRKMPRGTTSSVFPSEEPIPLRRVLAIARQLRAQGYSVGIISNTSHLHAKNFRPVLDSYLSFFPIVLSHRIQSRKPEYKIFNTARLRANVHFSEMAFVDDRKKNVNAAERLGIPAFLYKNPSGLALSLRRLGVSI